LRGFLGCALSVPIRMAESYVKSIYFASVGFQPAGHHLAATNAKIAPITRSPSRARPGGSNVLKRCFRPNKSDGERCKQEMDIGYAVAVR